jgi:ComF family protein
MSAWGRLLTALFHCRCQLCRARVDDALRGPLCQACESALPALAGRPCPRCGLPLRLGQACKDCRRLGPAFSAAVAGAPYRGPWRDLIKAYKFQGHRSLRRALGRRLLAACQDASWPLQAQAVVPVPCGRARLALRGYDPALDLARSLAQGLGLDCQPGLLIRRRAGRRQSRLSRKARLSAPGLAFAARLPESLRGARLLLVDDILTTGATADACSRALLEAGAGSVRVAVLARSL